MHAHSDANTGFLFFTDAASVPVTDGATVELWGRSWMAHHRPQSLELVAVRREDNRSQQLHNRLADMKREVQHRKQELKALSEQQAKLSSDLENVHTSKHC